ncbi:MAG: M48 family metalloprotease [Pseudomonadota bacterium]|nr:M48 family metalloprotease [Pseudomonadota bacterium]
MKLLQYRHRLAGLALILLTWLGDSPTAQAQTNSLPDLGDASSAIVSPEQERRLGRAWLRQLRSQAPIIHDPLLYDYLFNLVYRLAAASDIAEPDLALVLIKSPAINAFAVPGGVLGLNGGLLLNARTEDEVASVIAHELAHLSQRHFARGLERSQQNSWANLAAMLASVLVAATAGGDAGMAALATTQAASIDAQLRFSRANEREADRIGMQTLTRAGLNPMAMADFFEALQRSMRYQGERPPEFLLTHPVTESRITEARARAAQAPAQSSSDSLEFQLMKARLAVEFARDPSARIQELEQEKADSDAFLEVTEYTLACAYLETNQLDKALASIDRLLDYRAHRITYLATKAEILTKAGHYQKAIQILEQGLDYSPGNYGLSVFYADALTLAGNTSAAIKVLREQITQWQSQPLLWFMLAEAYGKAGDRLGVYQAKAEYYYLYGRPQQAIEQLKYALPLAQEDFNRTARISDRIQEIKRSMEDMRL